MSRNRRNQRFDHLKLWLVLCLNLSLVLIYGLPLPSPIITNHGEQLIRKSTNNEALDYGKVDRLQEHARSLKRVKLVSDREISRPVRESLIDGHQPNAHDHLTTSVDEIDSGMERLTVLESQASRLIYDRIANVERFTRLAIQQTNENVKGLKTTTSSTDQTSNPHLIIQNLKKFLLENNGEQVEKNSMIISEAFKVILLDHSKTLRHILEQQESERRSPVAHISHDHSPEMIQVYPQMNRVDEERFKEEWISNITGKDIAEVEEAWFQLNSYLKNQSMHQLDKSDIEIKIRDALGVTEAQWQVIKNVASEIAVFYQNMIHTAEIINKSHSKDVESLPT